MVSQNTVADHRGDLFEECARLSSIVGRGGTFCFKKQAEHMVPRRRRKGKTRSLLPLKSFCSPRGVESVFPLLPLGLCFLTLNLSESCCASMIFRIFFLTIFPYLRLIFVWLLLE